MYKVGDAIIYGNTGVCHVKDIAPHAIPGTDEECLYYTLTPVYEKCTIRIPVDCTNVVVRPVISEEKAKRLIDLIPTIEAEPYYNKAIREVTEHYKESMQSYACEDVLELTLSINAKKQELENQGRKLGSVDERFLQQAEDQLFGELAVALDIAKEEVPDYIASRMETKTTGVAKRLKERFSRQQVRSN